MSVSEGAFAQGLGQLNSTTRSRTVQQSVHDGWPGRAMRIMMRSRCAPQSHGITLGYYKCSSKNGVLRHAAACCGCTCLATGIA